MEPSDLAPGATRIVLDIEPDAQPIRGVLQPAVGAPATFTGWLELTRVLELLIRQAAHHPRAASPAPPAAGHGG